MSKKDRIVCGLDIGTTKICMLIARVLDDNSLEVVSSGYANSGGLHKGMIVDLEQAAASIRQAAEEAEAKSGHSVDWVTVGISGDHIKSFNCQGATTIEGKHNEVTAKDVAAVIHAASSIPIPPEREVIHVLTQEFFLDNRGNIQKPVGLTGSRLDANVHVVTCEGYLLQNLINAVNRAQMRVKKVVLRQLASADAVLTRDEKELGAALIDLGGGTTDIAQYLKQSIRFTSVLPVGGNHFTRDLAVGLRTPFSDADRIKHRFGSVLADSFAEDEMIEVPGVGSRSTRKFPRRMASEFLRARAIEVFELVKNEIRQSGGSEQLLAGAVLTGGGSLLHGMSELAEEILEMPIRQGFPQGIQGLTRDLSHPVYVTAIGLAMHGATAGSNRKRRLSNIGFTPWFLNRFLSLVDH